MLALLLCGVGTLPGPAGAVVTGSVPSLFQSFTVQGSAAFTGNTLMVYPLGDTRVNVELLDAAFTSNSLSGIPINATIEGAWVFYSGRTDVVADDAFDFYTPDGIMRPLVAPLCRNLAYGGEAFFYCRREVTAEVQAVSAARGGDVNGVYNVNGVQAKVGVAGTAGNGCDFSDIGCQAAYAGWSLVVVWSSEVAPGVRNLLLYDGFYACDETNTTGISAPIPLSGFTVGDPAGGEIAFFGLEGDAALGSPPGGPEWADFVRFNPQNGSGVLLQDSSNAPNNLFNATISQSSASFSGVDLDAYDLGPTGLNLLTPGDTSASIVPGSGDGIIDGAQEGELFILGWVLLGIDTIAPSLDQASTKTVDRITAASGETLTYTLVVKNTGNDLAPDVIVQDAPPVGTTYVAGTTTVDGAPIPDSGANSALRNGLNIGDLDYRLGTTTTRTVSFQVSINAGTADGASICNQATVDSARSTVVTLTTSPCTTVQAPELRDPQELSVVDLNGGAVEPGDRLRYRVRLHNDGNQMARQTRYTQNLPAYVKDLTVLTVPPGAVDASVPTRVDVTGISVPGNFSVEVLFEVTILTEAELISAGVASSAIDGLVLSTQGALEAAFLPTPIVTDDPTTPASPDPTRVQLSYAAELASSTKVGVDDDGAPLQGLDTVTYTLTLRNTGNRGATAQIVDDLPAEVENCVVVASPVSATCTNTGGANGTGQLLASNIAIPAGGQVTLTFRVRVRTDATDGATVRNRAFLTADEIAGTLTLRSSPLTVLNRAILSASTKAVSDPNGAPVEPGDQLNYTLQIRNTGNRIATQVLVDDLIDPDLTVLAVGQGGTLSGGRVTWTAAGTPTLAAIAPGEVVMLTLQARVNLPLANGTVIPNQATLTAVELSAPARTDDPATPTPGDATRVTVVSLPELVVEKRAIDLDGGPLRPGDRLRYELQIRNLGPGLATGVTVADPIPANTTVVRIEGGGTQVGNEVRWSVPDLGITPTGDQLLAFEVEVSSPLFDGTVLSNQARVSVAELAVPTLSDDPNTAAASDPTLVVVSSQADLGDSTKIYEDLSGGAHLPGDTVRYTLVLTNTGDAPARNVVVSDPIATCLTNVVPAQGGNLAAGQIVWTAATAPALARVDPGVDVSLTFEAQLDPALPDGSPCANQATILSSDLAGPTPTDDPGTAAVDDPTVIIVESRPALEDSEKQVSLVDDRNGDGTYSPGDRIRYTLLIRNTGTETAVNVRVRDPLPAELQNVVSTPAGTLVGGQLRWTFASLAQGASRTLMIEGDLLAPLDDGTVVSNQAFLARNGLTGEVVTDDPSTPDLDDATAIVLTAAPDLEGLELVAVDPNGTPLRPGETLNYQLHVENNGTALARTLVVRLPLPAETSFVSATAGGTFEASTSSVVWSLGDLSLGAANARDLGVQVTLDTPLDNGTPISAQASAAALGFAAPVLSDDPATLAPDDPTVMIVVSGADLTGAGKSVADANGGEVRPGDILVWTIQITNTGDAVARNVTVDDAFDPALGGLTPQQAGVVAGATVHWDAGTTPSLGAVAPGETRTLVVLSTVNSPQDDGTVIANQALVSADGLAAPIPTDDLSTAAVDDPTQVIVRAAPDLSATTKTFAPASGLPVHPGDAVTWTLSTRNTGDAIARATTLVDTLDPSLVFVSASDGGSYDTTAHRVSWSLGDLPPGPAVVRTLITRVVLPLDDGTLVSNQGLLQSPSLVVSQPTDDPATPGLGDATSFIVESAPDLAGSTKSVIDRNGGEVAPGDLLDYTISLVNSGDMTATGVLTSDDLPANLTFVSAADGGAFDSGSRRILWGARDLSPADPPVTLRFTGRVPALTANGTVISNQAQLQGAGQTTPTDDPSTPDPSDPTEVVVVSAPDFSSTAKTVVDQDGGLLQPGDLLEYTIVVRNTGNTHGTSVRVVDPIDPLLTDIQPGQGGVLSGGSLVWDSTSTPALAQVSPGAAGEVTLSFTARILGTAGDGDRISNQARIQVAELSTETLTDDPSTVPPSDPTVVVLSLPDLEGATLAALDVNGGELAPGDLIRWTVVVENLGSHVASAVDVRVALDPALLANPLPIDGAVQGEDVVWSLGDLAPGARRELILETSVVSLLANGTLISSQGSITFSERPVPVLTDDPVTPEIDDPTTVVVTSAPELVVSKRVEDLTGDVVVPGDLLRYTLTLENQGNTYATNVIVSDALPGTLASWNEVPAATEVGRTLTWTASEIPALSRMAPGEPVTITLEVALGTPLPDGTLVSNQARVFLAELPDAQPSDDPDTPAAFDATTVTVFSAPRFTNSEKTVVDLNGGLVEPGDLLEYTLIVLNDGTEDAIGSVLSDPTPANTRYVPGTTRMNDLPVGDPAGGGSPLAEGLTITSARADTPAGVMLVSDGQAPDDEVSVITFQVQVDAGVLGGVAISNQGRIASLRTTAVGTDDPGTPAEGDPTVVVVGRAISLTESQKSWILTLDEETPGVAEPGDHLAFEIVVPNRGTVEARSVEIRDPVPEGTRYLPGTLSLDGLPLTDAADGDPGSVALGAVRVLLPSLAAGASATVRFEVEIEADAGPTVVNQATVTGEDESGQQVQVLTDADLSVPGDQPNVIPVGDAPVRDLSTSVKAVSDLDGGVVDRGDLLDYLLVVRNTGNVAVSDIEVADALPRYLVYVSHETRAGSRSSFEVAPAGTGQGMLTFFRNDPLEAGASLEFRFRARVASDAPDGALISNSARLEANGVEPRELGPVVVVVGAAPGTGGYVGRVFLDADHDGRLSEGEGGLSGYNVSAVSPESGEVVRTAVSDSRGDFALVGLPAGAWTLRVATAAGTTFVQREAGGVSADALTVADGAVDPSGVVYRGDDGTGVADARVWLLYDTSRVGQAPLACDEDQRLVTLETNPELGASEIRPLPRAVGYNCLFPGQQGQRTPRGDSAGFYRFDVPQSDPAMDYQLQVVPPAPQLAFPSVVRPARPGAAPPGEVVPNAVPDLEGDTTWYLHFSIGSPEDEVTHNHVPLDPVKDLMQLTKVAARGTATVGELVAYTVTLKNSSGVDLRIGDLESEVETGVRIQDLIPRGMRYVAGTATASRLRVAPDGGLVRACPRVGEDALGCPSERGGPTPLVDTRQAVGEALTFGPYDLLAGEQLQLRYILAVGADARPGEASNLARATLDGIAVGEAEAVVRIVRDPLFDESTVLGKVFCDDNEDGRQQAGERGLVGATVWVDLGMSATSDRSGKFHFSRLSPGLRLFKLDPATLPPASGPVGPAGKPYYLTAGLDAVVDFPVRCALAEMQPTQLGVMRPRAPPRLPLVATTAPLDLQVGAEELDLPRIALRLTEPEAAARFDEPALPLALGEALPEVHLQASGTLRRWRVAVAPLPAAPESLQGSPDRGGPESWPRLLVIAGEGAPPPTVALPADLPRGVPLVIWAGAEGAPGLASRSSVQVFALGWVPPPMQPVDLTLEGELFPRKGAKPTAVFKKTFSPALEALKQNAAATVRVEVHVDASYRRRAGALSRQRAAAVKNWLVAAGIAADRITVEGKGSSQPLVPNVGRRNQRKNRRVKVEVSAPAPEVPALPGAELPELFAVNDAALTLDPTGSFADEVEVTRGGRLSVSLGVRRGARLGVLRRLDADGAMSPVDEEDPEAEAYAAEALRLAGLRWSVAPELGSGAVVVAQADPPKPPPVTGVPASPSGPALGSEQAMRLELPRGGASPLLTWEGARHSLPLLAVTGLREDEDGAVKLGKGGVPSRPIAFLSKLPGQVRVKEWELWIEDAEGVRVGSVSGQGAPPPRLRWDGRGPDGKPALLRGEGYRFRLRVADTDGNEGRGPWGTFAVANRGLTRTLNGLFTVGFNISPSGRAPLKAFARQVKAMGPGTRVTVTAHTDNTGSAEAALARTDKQAAVVARLLASYGLAPGSIRQVFKGDTLPLAPNLSARNKARNKRIVLRAVPGKPRSLPERESRPGVRIAGVEASAEEGGAVWTATVPLADPLVLEAVTAEGREASYRLTLTPEAGPGETPGAGGDLPLASSGAFAPRTRRAFPGGVLVAQGTRLGDDEEDEDGPGGLRDSPAPAPAEAAPAPAPATAAPAPAAPAAVALPLPPAEESPGGTRLGDDDDDEDGPGGLQRESDAAASPEAATVEAAPKAPPPTLAKIVETETELELVVLPREQIDGKKVPIADSVLTLPPAGIALKGARMPVYGRTAPGAQVTVGATSLKVDADGSFAGSVELPRGSSLFSLRIRDEAGNEAIFEREVVREASGLFILGLADTAMGTIGSELDGVGPTTSIQAGPLWLHGRAAAFVKGDWAPEDGPWEEIELQLHLDTARWGEEAMAYDLVNPDRGYLLYGDTGESETVAEAAGPLWMRLKADQSQLDLGNVQTRVGTGGLFDYRRSLYGGRLHLDETLAEKFRFEVDAFGSAGELGQRPAHAVLQGTGGSLFFLPDRDVIEGSERLMVNVRDRQTGMVLYSRPLQRNVDYTFRSDQGLILLKSPLPSVAHAGWLGGMNAATPLDDHPVFLVVDYNHRELASGGLLSAGGYARHTYDGWLTVGGGLLAQDIGPTSSPYRLWGLSAEIRPKTRSYLRLEYAHSEGTDLAGSYSADGGLSYSGLVPACENATLVSERCGGQGHAFSLEGALSLGELMGKSTDIVLLTTRLELQEQGFYASQRLLDQGQSRGGVQLSWEITEADDLVARFDHVRSQLPTGVLGEEGGRTKEVQRSSYGLRYAHTAEKWRAFTEWNGAVVGDEELGRISSDRLLVGGEFDLSHGLSLLIDQDLTLGGDDRVFPSIADRLSSGVGLRYRLTETLELSLMGRVRWSGENALTAGARVRTGESGSIYANERLIRPVDGGWRSTSVVGAEQAIGGLRTHGEYQVDGGLGAKSGRAVLGVGHTFTLAKGLKLDLSYERVQVIGDVGASAALPGSTLDPVTGRSSSGGRVDGLPPFASVGANPAGIFYPGAVSRDAASVAAAFSHELIETSLRLELRYDNADDDLVGTLDGVADRVQGVVAGNLAWHWTRDLALIGRLNWLGTHNIDEALAESLWMESSAGLAYRPTKSDLFSVLFKATHLVDQRPLNLALGTSDRQVSEVFSLAPVLETPWRIGLSEKVAYKRTRLRVGIGEGLTSPEVVAHSVLWVNRLDFHATRHFDLSAEYRLLWVAAGALDDSAPTELMGGMRSGAVFEAAYRMGQNFRLGAGWSFASFSDDELARFDTDASGPFLRITGIY